MLVDTDVLIWHLRGYAKATRRLDNLGALTLSAVSYLEVLQGIRNEAELAAVKKMPQYRAATLLPVSEAITQRATALDHGLPVLTANVKHFGAVPGLTIEAFLP